jgi:hypothetical protein
MDQSCFILGSGNLCFLNRLSLRFPETYPDLAVASKLKADCQAMINEALKSLEFKRSKKKNRKVTNTTESDEDKKVADL